MKLLAIDIGVGTSDVMLIDPEKSLENCIKFVLPSPAQTYAGAVARATTARKELYIFGDTVGGGPFASAIKRHIAAGLKVAMTPQAAFSIRNDLSEVQKLGIDIADHEFPPLNFDGCALWLQEVRLRPIFNFLRKLGERDEVGLLALAVQDHGISPKGISNRITRIDRFKKFLSNDPRLESLMYPIDQIPGDFIRMRSAADRAKKEAPDAKIFVMDTSPVAALGCLADPRVREDGRVLAINFGNGHSLAVLFNHGKVVRGFEAHTKLFENSVILKKYLEDFIAGKLTDERVFGDGGHGLFSISQRAVVPDQILVTGPRRGLMEATELNFRYATPAGDIMMTGPVGLYRAIKSRFFKDL
ncbi:MAG: DUF1786 family protein [Methanomassiliicoccales archaeon]|jgi:uncharacterized protein (DUF1786 family)|nr:DUF1786 family protein [Methanomassiliicoccales archaeon]